MMMFFIFALVYCTKIVNRVTNDCCSQPAGTTAQAVHGMRRRLLQRARTAKSAGMPVTERANVSVLQEQLQKYSFTHFRSLAHVKQRHGMK